MKYLSYILIAIINIIVLFVVVAIFDRAYSSFETIVYALLVLVFLAMRNFSERYKIATLSVRYELGEQINNVVQVLKKDSNYTDYWQEKKKEMEDGLNQYLKEQWIDNIFAFIIYLYVLWQLFNILL